MRGFTSVKGREIRNSTLVRGWRCGVCEGKLKEIWSEGDMAVVCATDRAHDQNSFITVGSLEVRIHNEMVQGETLAQLERGGNVALKDRDTAYGVPKRLRLSRIGRVRQGKMEYSEKAKRKIPVAVPYFIIDPSTNDENERAEILAAVRAAIEQAAPPQNLDEPTVLPIRFLASEPEIISPESYKKRRGKKGTVWCAGDGEYIQWKLTDDFKVEIAGGEPEIECPGGERDPEKRHPWCDECAAEVELNFSFWGYERTGTWMIRTKAMGFRDQFRTVMGMVREMIGAGIIPGIASVPFLLRRQIEEVLAPSQNDSLISTTMPLTSIEIEPEWFQDQMRKHRDRHTLAAPAPTAMIESGEAEVVIINPGELPGVPYSKIDDWNNEAEFWTEMIRQASTRLGYEDEEEVKGALKALFGSVDGAAGYKPEDIWQMLREHKVVPLEAHDEVPF